VCGYTDEHADRELVMQGEEPLVIRSAVPVRLEGVT
jgi:hypothetical protein